MSVADKVVSLNGFEFISKSVHFNLPSTQQITINGERLLTTTDLDSVSGLAFLSGNIDPVNDDGAIGDYYINNVSKTVFGPKTLGGWGVGFSMIGTNNIVLGDISSVPNEKGLSLTGNILRLHAADGLSFGEDGSGGVVTRDPQSFYGEKSFLSPLLCVDGLQFGDDFPVNPPYNANIFATVAGCARATGVRFEFFSKLYPMGGLYLGGVGNSVELRPPLSAGEFVVNYPPVTGFAGVITGTDPLPATGICSIEPDYTLSYEQQYTSPPEVMTLNSGNIISSTIQGEMQQTPGTMFGIRFTKAGRVVWVSIPIFQIIETDSECVQINVMQEDAIPKQFRPMQGPVGCSIPIFNENSITSTGHVVVTVGGGLNIFNSLFTNKFGSPNYELNFHYMV